MNKNSLYLNHQIIIISINLILNFLLLLNIIFVFVLS